MIAYLHLKDDVFTRIVQLQVLKQFRPVDQPFTNKGMPCYFDGVEILQIALDVPEAATSSFVLNNTPNVGVPIAPAEPYLQSHPLPFSPLRVDFSMQLLLVSDAALTAASQVQPDGSYPFPVRDPQLTIPLAHAIFQVTLVVDAGGVPQLQIDMVQDPLGADMFAGAESILDGVRSISIPLPLADAFADALEPGRSRVLNAGLTRTEGPGGGVVVFRLEFEPAAQGAASDIARLREWDAFFHRTGLSSPLDGRDWAIELPTDSLLRGIAAQLDAQLDSADVRSYFERTGDATGSLVEGHPPEFYFSVDGILESVCGGLDVQARISATATLTSQGPNVARVSVDIGLHLDAWDSFKCTVLSILNPFAGLITTVDKGLPWFATPVVHLFLVLIPIARMFGADDIVLTMALKQAAAELNKGSGPKVVRTSPSTFYVDLPFSVQTSLLQNWLSVDDYGTNAGRLVVRGAFTAPDLKTLPRLQGTLVDPFEFWSLVDRCSTNRKWTTSATLGLDVDKDGTVVYHPDVPIAWGVHLVPDAQGKLVAAGNATWQLLADLQGVYAGPRALTHWSGIPGSFDVEVTDPPPAFAQAPYPFRLRFFTSFGVREYAIPAPPPPPAPPATEQEVIALEAARISECYIFTSLIDIVKALQVVWIPDPPDGSEVTQHWQIVVDGLRATDRVHVWNGDTGEPLAEAGALLGSRTELSLLLPPARAATTLQITMNDDGFLPARAYAERLRALPTLSAHGTYSTRVRQTRLRALGTIALFAPATELLLQQRLDGLRVVAQGAHGTTSIDTALGATAHVVGYTLSHDATPLRVQSPSHRFAVLRERHDDRDVVVLRVSHDAQSRGAEHERSEDRAHALRRESHAHEAGAILARYNVRPWYDRGSVAGPYFAQLDEAGTAVTIFDRGATREVPPEIGRVLTSP
jgi:hypothetical protein